MALACLNTHTMSMFLTDVSTTTFYRSVKIFAITSVAAIIFSSN